MTAREWGEMFCKLISYEMLKHMLKSSGSWIPDSVVLAYSLQLGRYNFCLIYFALSNIIINPLRRCAETKAYTNSLKRQK